MTTTDNEPTAFTWDPLAGPLEVVSSLDPCLLRIGGPEHVYVEIPFGRRLMFLGGREADAKVVIHLDTGDVEVRGDVTEAARAFWQAVRLMEQAAR